MMNSLFRLLFVLIVCLFCISPVLGYDCDSDCTSQHCSSGIFGHHCITIPNPVCEAGKQVDCAARALRADRARAEASLLAMRNRVEASAAAERTKINAEIASAKSVVATELASLKKLITLSSVQTQLSNTLKSLESQARTIADSQLNTVLAQVKKEALDAIYLAIPAAEFARLTALTVAIAQAKSHIVSLFAHLRELQGLVKGPLASQISAIHGRIPALLNLIQTDINEILNPLTPAYLNLGPMISHAKTALNDMVTTMRANLASVTTVISQGDAAYNEAKSTANAVASSIADVNTNADNQIQQQLTIFQNYITTAVLSEADDLTSSFIASVLGGLV